MEDCTTELVIDRKTNDSKRDRLIEREREREGIAKDEQKKIIILNLKLSVIGIHYVIGK